MSTTPGGPEYLDAIGAGGSAHAADHGHDNDNRKRLIVLGALVAGGAVVAGGAWAATSFFATGSQPAEALPDSTIAYFSVDLDPSGGQKIEAIKTLRKFPGVHRQDRPRDRRRPARALLRGDHQVRRVRGPRLRRGREAVARLPRRDGRGRPRRGRAGRRSASSR